MEMQIQNLYWQFDLKNQNEITCKSNLQTRFAEKLNMEQAKRNTKRYITYT